jgi:hypothetical protein
MQPDESPRQFGDVGLFLIRIAIPRTSVEALKQENVETVKMCVV